VHCVDEALHVVLAEALTSENFNGLVEALVHFRKGIDRRLGGQNLQQLVDGAGPEAGKLVRGAAVVLLVRTEKIRDKLGRHNADGVVEEEGETRDGNLLHDLRGERGEVALENLGIDNQEFNGHVFVVHRACPDSDSLTAERHQLPAVVLLELLNLLL
jgi:hypothetical protein